MDITANVVLDSITNRGHRLTTLELCYPRIPVHEQFMTHRMMARNAQSARAVPIAVLCKMVEDDPYCPTEWGLNGKGMLPTGRLDREDELKAGHIWKRAMDAALSAARELADLGVHKETANRLIQPFAPIRVLASSTDWDLFLRVRDRKEPQREMRMLAEAVRTAIQSSVPATLRSGSWHLPYIGEDDLALPLADQIRVAVARCARVSYGRSLGRSHADDLDLAARLQHPDEEESNAPIHGSAFEHIAQALPGPYKCGAFTGWHQYRADVDPAWRW